MLGLRPFPTKNIKKAGLPIKKNIIDPIYRPARHSGAFVFPFIILDVCPKLDL
jgi:hypothetical protein